MHKWTHYIDVYNKHFAQFVDKDIKFLEIGVHKGGSLDMWANVLGPNAQILGIDIEPECKNLEKNNTKINPARYKTAKQIAYDVLAFDAYKDIIPKSVLFFHNLSVQPNWPYHKVAQIGNHIFYTKAKYVAKKPQRLKEQTVAIAD
jgi:hypothetical protein